MLATAVFAEHGGLVHGETSLFLTHLAAMAIVGAFSYFGSNLLFLLVDSIIPLRVPLEQEEEGLDISQHAERLF